MRFNCLTKKSSTSVAAASLLPGVFLFASLSLGYVSTAGAASHIDESAAIIRYNAIHHPVISRKGMVSSQRMLASQIGADILASGGNAVDAAVATGIALAVTLPRAGNLGGGGFMLAYLADQDRTVAIDYREMAPGAAYRNMYLDSDGNVDAQRERFSHLASGVPGTVAGFDHALEHYGSMSWAEVLAPSIKLARDGFVVSYDLAENLKSRRQWLTKNTATAKAYYKAGGQPYEPGEILKQPDLAWTLEQIAKQGAKAFYRGAIAKKIADEMQRGGGLIKLDDLANYRIAERAAVATSYRGYEVVSMPPTSSGGVHIVQMLNMLERFPMQELGAGSAAEVHLLTEAMKQAYADRSEYLGDPDHTPVPIAGLTSKAYAAQLNSSWSMDRAKPSRAIRPGQPAPYEGPDTTHFSVMDAAGNAVANTYTLNFSYGSGIVIPGTGILMNNEMADFAAKPGVPNAFGLMGGEANAIAPTKRPLSSMTPTIIFKQGKPFVVTGSPGGSRIISTVLQVLVNVMDHQMNMAEAINRPRIHHQWLPDQLELEPGFSPDTIELLKQKGHKVVPGKSMGSVQSIMWSDGVFYGASDPRRPDAGTVGID